MSQRNPGVVLLLQDHHHGLVLALRLRQGDNALLTDGWTHDRREQARRAGRFFEEELRPHFAAEEEALFPAMRAHVPTATALVDTLTIQHRQLRGLTTLAESGRRPILDHILTGIGELLERHIRLEERSLFPLFDSSMPDELALQVAKEIEHILVTRGGAWYGRNPR